MTTPINITDRFDAFTRHASPVLLEAAAAALIATASNLAIGTPGERQFLAQVAADMRTLAYAKLTGVGK